MSDEEEAQERHGRNTRIASQLADYAGAIYDGVLDEMRLHGYDDNPLHVALPMVKRAERLLADASRVIHREMACQKVAMRPRDV